VCATKREVQGSLKAYARIGAGNYDSSGCHGNLFLMVEVATE
jgi:hypothetical protein